MPKCLGSTTLAFQIKLFFNIPEKAFSSPENLSVLQRKYSVTLGYVSVLQKRHTVLQRKLSELQRKYLVSSSGICFITPKK